MKNLMTRKLLFDILMTLVLAFSVQGIADALTFGTTRRGDLATKSPGEEFTITFSVSLGSNTTRITDANGMLIKDSSTTGGDANARIDSSGYLVVDIGTRAYRTITINPTDTLVVDPRPTYDDETPNVAGSPSSPYYVDSSKNVVDSQGRAVYVQTGGGDRVNNDPWRYTRAKADPTDKVPDANRYHFNQEQVNVAVTGANIIKVGSASIAPASSVVLMETSTDNRTKLTSSVTLTLTAATAEVVEIDITDTTPEADRPGAPAPQIDFTVYVVSPQSAVVATGTTAFGTGNDGIEYAYDGERRQINSYFTFIPTDDAPVHYSVEGSGRVYIWLSSSRNTSPTNSLFTSSNAPVYLDTNRGTSKVTVWVSGTTPRSTVFIFQGASPDKFTSMEITQGDGQTGATGGRLEDYLAVKVTDGNNRPIPGVAIRFSDTPTDSRFIPVSGTKVYVSDTDALMAALEDPVNAATFTATANKPAPANTIFVQTDNSGVAKVYYQLDPAEADYRVTASLSGSPTPVMQVFRSTAVSDARNASLAIVSGDGQSAAKGEPLDDPLVVIARSTAGYRIPDVQIEFEATTGLLEPSIGTEQPTGTTVDSGNEILVVTGSDGTASVEYNVGQLTGGRSVTAEVTDEQSTDVEYDFVIDRVEFRINGGRSTTRTPTPTPTPTPQPQTRSIQVTTTSQSAAPGDQVTVTASLPQALSNVLITFTANGGVFSSPTVATSTSGVAQSNFFIPSGVSSVIINADAPGYDVGRATITVTGATAGTGTETQTATVGEPVEITIYDGDDQEGEINSRLDDDLVVQVVDRNGNGVSFETVRFRVVEGSGRLSPTNTRTDRDGLADATFTPRSQGTVEVEAFSGDLSPVIFTVNVGEPPDAIIKVSGDDQSGRPGARLANPFVVEVVDENDDPVSGATVAFSVTAGDGTLSATSAATGNNGRAQTTLTLGDEVGDNTVSARVTGLPAVTFTASAGATVLVSASNRAPIYWIDKQNGTLHRLVDDDVENLASNVEGVTSLAVDEANGLIYWGVQVGRSGGKIQRSRLNGRNVQVLKDGLTSIPMGIALDAAGGTIYWTSASGKIRSMATEGSTKVTKILEDLANPTVLAVSNGYLYWVEPLGRVRRVSLTATRKVAVNIATGLGEPLSIAIANGKIYWVERSGSGGGALQRANLNGGNIEELKAFTGGVPVGISIDRSENKIYWTKLSKIQRTNLAGRSVIDVVTGLTRPSAIALGKTMLDEPVVTETKKPKTTKTTTTTTTTYSKYDINKDGTVNNADTKAVAGAVGQSGAAITNPRTDIDGSGMVDVTDLILVIANLDDDVAAPAIDVDLTAMDLDFDRVAEQIEVLLASGDRSHAAQRALMYLQHLLASARPDVTVLLANYPNPFNPETWIPYHLATSTDVKINIYNSQGILVRALTLGHQSAGYYTSRSRAAYWDGRNALGERVASGIYFYQLQADEISPLRKMVILK